MPLLLKLTRSGCPGIQLEGLIDIKSKERLAFAQHGRVVDFSFLRIAHRKEAQWDGPGRKIS
jgi:hypothetical protein